MNRHFTDAAYYVRRAAEHAKLGVEAEVRPVVRRLRARLGREPVAPEPSRLNRLRRELAALEQRAEGGARRAVGTVRERLRFRSV